MIASAPPDLAVGRASRDGDRVCSGSNPLSPPVLLDGDAPGVFAAHAVLYTAHLAGALDLAALCRVHRLVCPDTGVARSPLRAGGAVIRLGGKVHHRPPPAPSAQRDAEAALTMLDGSLRAHPSAAAGDELAAEAMARLCAAHPFRDGNGRVARAVAVWVIAACGAVPVPAVALRVQLYHNAERYYDALAAYERDADMRPWCALFRESIERCRAT